MKNNLQPKHGAIAVTAQTNDKRISEVIPGFAFLMRKQVRASFRKRAQVKSSIRLRAAACVGVTYAVASPAAIDDNTPVRIIAKQGVRLRHETDY
ncbi:hypothetical protein [Saccharibacillus endophyticus]|uniref:Uncharacterized protein n=1 Tax=Saccharibacillus endophyticus TaxID=2060666 RepID=A0ABQ2A5V8_9BACL|nr:hypothetical protein [Saccharibacillus endophyticus]GGH86253.1 hypothetical protein GCM10007362_45590 [Saccharibacillus endophyticus]